MLHICTTNDCISFKFVVCKHRVYCDPAETIKTLLWQLLRLSLLQSSQIVLCAELMLCFQRRPGKLMREQLYAYSDGTAIGRQSARLAYFLCLSEPSGSTDKLVQLCNSVACTQPLGSGNAAGNGHKACLEYATKQYVAR